MAETGTPIIKISNVKKEFILPQHKRTSVKQLFISLGRRNVKTRQKALKGIDFNINRGEFFGIVGRNGSGKSTLLKILAGVYSPSSGAAYVEGSLTPFIELGVGFNPELSGRDNVFLNGALLGFSRKEMHAMYDDIVAYAELNDFMDQKLKNYSSGMVVRLAFSIAIRVESDIILIDEVLAVGDANFQKKCLETFKDFKNRKQTVVFVTHSMNYVRDFCDRVAVIDRGDLRFVGDTEQAIDIYNKLNNDDEKIRLEAENKKLEETASHLGNGKAKIESFKVYNHKDKESVELTSGQKFSVKVKFTGEDSSKNIAVGVLFREDPQVNLYGLNSFIEGHKIKELKKGQTYEVTYSDTMPLNPGTYFMTFAIASMTNTGYEDLDNLNNIIRVNVVGPKDYWGLLNSTPEVTIHEVSAGEITQ